MGKQNARGPIKKGGEVNENQIWNKVQVKDPSSRKNYHQQGRVFGIISEEQGANSTERMGKKLDWTLSKIRSSQRNQKDF